jgi:signal transduction histidine kinase
MKKLRLLILIFCLALSVPLAYMTLQTYTGLAREEIAKLNYFAGQMFDEIENELSALVAREEARSVDEYNFAMIRPGSTSGAETSKRSPLARIALPAYILGYIQNNPDGSFHTPLVEERGNIPKDLTSQIAKLKLSNEIFNSQRFTGDGIKAALPAPVAPEKKESRLKGFAEQYLNLPSAIRSAKSLGQKEKRIEEITPGQARQIAGKDKQAMGRKPSAESPAAPGVVILQEESQALKDDALFKADGKVDAVEQKTVFSARRSTGRIFDREGQETDMETMHAEGQQPSPAHIRPHRYQVEIAPLQAVILNDDQIFIFRRIVIHQQIFRQGFVLQVRAFLRHLATTHFMDQPMAGYAGLRLVVMDRERAAQAFSSGVSGAHPTFQLERQFPAPFGFLQAVLTCQEIPRAAGRSTLNTMMVLFAAVLLIGLAAIYRSARAEVELSQRRSKFVSSVTHELKTPLTNIRMYIEMLEQGIASSPEKEQAYLRILGSESARLSRLINNVMEISRLEKKQRPLTLSSGGFEDVIGKVTAVMQETVRQEGFVLKTELAVISPFAYDAEVMLQVLINLIENSLKFGKKADRREIFITVHEEPKNIVIRVSDTGPGIPRHALKKVFDDFYRVEGALTRSTGGTGIGLALVKKFVAAMGGTVSAANNAGPGCTISICLPRGPVSI